MLLAVDGLSNVTIYLPLTVVLQELAMQIAKELDVSIDVLKQNHSGGAIGAQLGACGR
jgi:hypothetical protein